MRRFWIYAIPFLVIVLCFGFAVWLAKGKSALAQRLSVRFGAVKKADEMERQIQYKAVSLAYMVVMLGLLCLTFYSVFVKGESMPLSNAVLLAGVLTQSIAVLVLRHRNTAGDEEYKAYPIWKTLLWIVGFAAVITVVGCALIFSGLSYGHGM